MKILISGGCKNGKSSYAQDLAVQLAGGGPLYYVATMIPYDDEDRERVKKHVENRAGLGFITLEQPRDLSQCLEHADPTGTFLLDSVTALLLNELFSETHNGDADPEGSERCRNECLDFAARVKNVVFVSDYIYSDAQRYDEFTENYRRSLAASDRALSAVCDTVIEVSAGIRHFHKGCELLKGDRAS